MAFQPAFGHLFTDSSIKKVVLAAILIFEVGSILCAAAQNTVMLIIGRLIAGAGGAGLYVGSLAFMALAVPVRKRALYISIVTSMFGVASVAGPLLGGVFTDSSALTWRFCFWINLRECCVVQARKKGKQVDVSTAIGFIAVVLVAASSEAPAPPQKSKESLWKEFLKLDPLGICLLLAAFICLLLALDLGGITYPWSDSRVWGCLLGFGLLISAFTWLQVYGDYRFVQLLFHQHTKLTIPIEQVYL